MRKHKRVMFEHQLKSHFLKKTLNDILQRDNNDQIGKTIPHINILLSELKQELQIMGDKMVALQKKLETIISQRKHSEDHIQSAKLSSADDSSVPILNRGVNISKRNKIPNVVLDLAIGLYKKLNSWKQVCNELATQGYLSSNNRLYTASSLSRAVSRYKSTVNIELKFKKMIQTCNNNRSNFSLWLSRDLARILKDQGISLNQELRKFFQQRGTNSYLNIEVTLDSYPEIQKMMKQLNY